MKKIFDPKIFNNPDNEKIIENIFNIVNKDIINYNNIKKDFILVIYLNEMENNPIKFIILPEYNNQITKNELICYASGFDIDINYENNKYILMIPLTLYNGYNSKYKHNSHPNSK